MTEIMDTGSTRLKIPVLTLRGLTVFPELLLHFDVGRDASIRALEEAMEENREIFLVTQRDLTVENPEEGDLYDIGTVAEVKQILRLPENGVRVMVAGRSKGPSSGLGIIRTLSDSGGGADP